MSKSTSNMALARKNMVDCQIHTAGVVNPAILDAYGVVPREIFAPERLKAVACADEDLALGTGRFLLNPITHAKMMQALEPTPDENALDVGGCTGYSAAILSFVASRVTALESDEGLLNKAKQLWPQIGRAPITGAKGPLIDGWHSGGPFDLIFFNGAATEVPAKLASQLSDRGRMVFIKKAPGSVMGQALLVQKTPRGSFASYPLFEAAAPYLPGFEPQPVFKF